MEERNREPLAAYGGAMNYLAAIGRMILARKWTPRQAFLLRRQIIKIANWLPTRWERQRAPNGRFKGTL